MGKFKRKTKSKINRQIKLYNGSSGIFERIPSFETDEEIAHYLLLLRKQHDKEAEYIANNLGLIY